MNLNPRLTPSITLVLIVLFGGLWIWSSGERRLTAMRADLSNEAYEASRVLGSATLGRSSLMLECMEAGEDYFKAIESGDRVYGKRIDAQRHTLERANDNLAAFDRMYPRVRARTDSLQLEMEAARK